MALVAGEFKAITVTTQLPVQNGVGIPVTILVPEQLIGGKEH